MKNTRIKVCFIIPTLFAGGAERVISFVSQKLDKEKFDVTLVVVGFEKDSKYSVDKSNTIFLNRSRVSNSILPIMQILIRYKPKVVISSISHLNMVVGLIAFFFPKITFVGRQANISKVSSQYNNAKNTNKIFKLIGNISIKKMDYFICQSSDMKYDFIENNNIPEKKIKIIHNPITQTSSLRTPKTTNTLTKHFITVGRLVKIKGYERILEILSKVKIDFKYTIIGEGEEKENIFKRIEELNLTDKIKYVEYTKNISEFLKNSDFFLQGSYSEGFPNTLLESCSVGLPVIAFNVPGGTKDIVQNNLNGYLVENESEFLSKLNNLKEFDPEVINKSVTERFGENIIIEHYESFIEEIIKK